eukprot:UN25258
MYRSTPPAGNGKEGRTCTATGTPTYSTPTQRPTLSTPTELPTVIPTPSPTVTPSRPPAEYRSPTPKPTEATQRFFCLITVDFDDKVTVEEVENTADALANSVCQALETSIGIESFKSPCVLKSSETETKEVSLADRLRRVLGTVTVITTKAVFEVELDGKHDMDRTVIILETEPEYWVEEVTTLIQDIDYFEDVGVELIEAIAD